MLKSSSSNRLTQYKNSGRNVNRSFKDNLRKKCADRLRANRSRQHNQHRNIDENITEVVKQTIHDEMGDLLSADEQLAMFEELREELLREEYEVWTCSSTLENELLSHLEPDVFCPKCKLHPMLIDKTGCICQSCGFSHQFGSSAAPSASQFAEILQSSFSQHCENGCEFLPDPVQNGYSLGLKCERCAFTLQLL